MRRKKAVIITPCLNLESGEILLGVSYGIYAWVLPMRVIASVGPDTGDLGQTERCKIQALERCLGECVTDLLHIEGVTAVQLGKGQIFQWSVTLALEEYTGEDRAVLQQHVQEEAVEFLRRLLFLWNLTRTVVLPPKEVGFKETYRNGRQGQALGAAADS